MKRISWILMAVVVFGALYACPVFGEEPVVIASYDSAEAYTKAASSRTQGVDGWYYREYQNEVSTDMVWNASTSRWCGQDTTTYIKADTMGPGSTSDADLVFVAPMKGNVQISGTMEILYNSGNQGDGADAVIAKNNRIMWSGHVQAPDETAYSVTFSVRQGDEIHFRLNCCKHNAYDMVSWHPVVNYVTGEYINDDDKFTYFQYDGSELTPLTMDETFDNGNGGYVAADGVAFISDSAVMPTQAYALLQRCTAAENGRYRVYGRLNAADNRGGGNVVTVFKNGEAVWKQLFVENEDGNFDVRMLAEKDDVFDIMISVYAFTGYNRAEWMCDVVKYFEMPPCTASTIGGHSIGVVSETALSDLISPAEGSTRYYSIKNDREYPMEYNAANARWQSTVTSDGGYIAADTVLPGREADSVIETTVERDGILRIVGDMSVSGNSEGVLNTVWLNGEKLWSSRVGEERSVRWDEPYDVSYFLNRIDVTAMVRAGDTLTFRFNHWRIVQNDEVNISNVRLQYLMEGALSKTTKWKLQQSTVVDTAAALVYRGGAAAEVDVIVRDGTTYVAAAELEAVLPEAAGGVYTPVSIDGKEYLPLRDTAEAIGKNVLWAADRLVLIYDGIPVLFGYPELSEIAVVMQRGGLVLE